MKKKIAIFLNAWSNQFCSLVLEGIRKKAKIDGVDLFIYGTYIFIDDATAQNVCQLNIFQLPNPDDYDGAILFSNSFNLKEEQESILELWKSHDVPILSLEVQLPDIAYIGTDNYKGVAELATHLVTVHNCKNIIYVGGIKDNQENLIRLQALTDTLKTYGLELQDKLFGDYGFFTATDLAEDWLKSGRPLPDAFVCANDYTAAGFSAVLMEHDIKVPEDVIITGFDNSIDLKNTFPMLASVTRGWDKLGEHAYDKLLYLTNHRDAKIENIYSSSFVPNESCGCQPSSEDAKTRLKLIRSIYPNSTINLTLDMYFQKIGIALSKLERKEDFYVSIKDCMEQTIFPGTDYCLCVEPLFFESDESKFSGFNKGYSYKMEVLYEMRDGKSIPPYTFDRTDPVPNYVHNEGESNTYLFLPFNHMNYNIGYLVAKNDMTYLYNQILRRWVINMNTCFMQARQYAITQKANQKLRDIYMTDFLTNMYNRTGCEEVIYHFVENELTANRDVIILFADIDYMKTINDNYGHLNGDFAIKATADALRHCLGNEWLYGRYGGDEFIAVGRCYENMDMSTFREKLLDGMQQFFAGLNVNFPLSASVGYTIVTPKDKGNISDFIKRADTSMYEEKLKTHGE